MQDTGLWRNIRWESLGCHEYNNGIALARTRLTSYHCVRIHRSGANGVIVYVGHEMHDLLDPESSKTGPSTQPPGGGRGAEPPQPESVECCGNCQFSGGLITVAHIVRHGLPATDVVSCRYNAPVNVSGNFQGFPVVRENQWCGRWEPMKKDRLDQ